MAFFKVMVIACIYFIITSNTNRKWQTRRDEIPISCLLTVLFYMKFVFFQVTHTFLLQIC